MLKTPLRVGALVLAAAAAFFVFYIAINKNSYSKRSTYEVSALFDDATGLASKTRIQIAGIDVGRVERIVLEGNRARVVLRIKIEVPIFQDGSIAKVSESLLGDFKLDITPGSPSLPRLPDGGEISHVKSQSDLNAIQGEMRHIAENVSAITDSLKAVLGTQNGENSLRTIVARIESATEAVDSIAQSISRTVDNNDRNINGILQNVADLSAKLNRIADSVGGIIGNNEGDMKQSVASLRQAMDKLNDSLGHINNSVKKIDEGQGTVGKLINDSTLHDNISEVAENVNALVKRVGGFETELELRAEYHVPLKPDDVLINKDGYLKTYVGIKLKPKPDTYYMLQVISDPRGTPTRTVTTSRRNPRDTLESPLRIDDTTTISFNSLKFSAEFAKRFWFITLRFGIIENTGGAGFDLMALEDKLRFTADVFQFGTRDRFGSALNPVIKSYISYEPLKHLYFNAGVEDPLNIHYFTITAGAGVRFNDDDVRGLLGIAATAATK